MRPASISNQSNMTRMLLRDKATGLFFVGRRQWTFEPESAREFSSLISALQASAQENMQSPELVFHEDGSDLEIVWNLKKDPVPNRSIET